MNAFLLLADANIAAKHDQTWIYSTLAQTAGALVGLLGAVLVSRVLSHMSLLQNDIQIIRTKIHHVLLMLEGTREAVLGRQEHPAHDGATRVWFKRLADDRKTVPNGRVEPADILNLADRLRSSRAACPETFGDTGFCHQIDRDISSLDALAAKIVHFHLGLLPASFWWVFAVLVFLSVVGVIWPLWELAALTDEPWSKVWLILLLFDAGVVALTAYFVKLIFELNSLRHFNWLPTDDSPFK